MYITHSQSRENVSVRTYIPPVLFVGTCVKGVTITHDLPWLTVCFYQLYHTRFDVENCVALGYPSQALLLPEPFAKFHDRLFSFLLLLVIYYSNWKF